MKQKKNYDNDWPIVAICYDFDKTLSPRDMQEFSLIPKMKLQPREFWKESGDFAKRNGMDNMLSYMKLVIEKIHSIGDKITYSDFKKMGAEVELFDGVETWFERINAYGQLVKANIEHYIISAGLKEIIEGTKIAKYFTEIYASSFIYDQYKKPIWPRQVVNYTTKTQYLFRINKDCLDMSDETSVNQYMEDRERRIPFKNFIYIGDSDTDIPAMRVVKRENGHAIGVYNPDCTNLEKVCNLIGQKRIDYFAPADYSEHGMLEKIVHNVIDQIKVGHEYALRNNALGMINDMENSLAKDYKYIKGFCDFVYEHQDEDGFISEDLRNYAEAFMKDHLKKFEKDYKEQYKDLNSIIRLLNKDKTELMKSIKKKSKQLASEETSNQ